MINCVSQTVAETQTIFQKTSIILKKELVRRAGKFRWNALFKYTGLESTKMYKSRGNQSKHFCLTEDDDCIANLIGFFSKRIESRVKESELLFSKV